MYEGDAFACGQGSIQRTLNFYLCSTILKLLLVFLECLAYGFLVRYGTEVSLFLLR